MSANRGTVSIVGEWVAKADNDLTTAIHTLKLGRECPTDTVCFHAQQCVEKYLKAVLILHGIVFPRVHNIEELMALVPEASQPPITARDQERLTDFAAGTRYPGMYEPIALAEARKVVALARKVRAHLRKILPREALSRRP